MRETVIVEAVRTPVGKRNGGLSDMHAADLSAIVLNALVERAGIDPAIVDDVVWGCVSQVGDQSSNIGRYSVLAAGWPEHIPGTTINRACGSSQQALDFAVQGVMSGQQDVVVAGGVEVMSRVPLGAARATGMPYGPKVLARYGDFCVQPGHLGRTDFAEVGLHAHPARRVLGALARAGGRGTGQRCVRDADDAGVHRRRAGGRRRGRTAGEHRREACRTEACIQGRRRHPRRQLVADLRRRGGSARDDRRARHRAGPDADCAVPRRARSPERIRC